MSTNRDKTGTTNQGVSHPKPKLRDMSDAPKISIRSGANIRKQSPGMNTQIVPPTPLK